MQRYFPLIVVLLLACETRAAQLKANDPSFNNGPALSECAQKSIPVPAGVYYVASTIETGADHGGRLVGVGRSCEEMAEFVYFKQPVTVLVWNGKPGTTLLHIQRQGFVVEDLTLQGASWKKNWDPPGTGSLVDVEQAFPINSNNRPCGNITFNRVTFLAAAYGVRVLRGDHGDHLALRDCVSEGCNIVYQSNEPQSVECFVDHLTVKLNCKYVFDFKAGGRFQCNHVLLTGQCTGAILSLGDAAANTGPDENNGYYELFVFLDNVVGNPKIAGSKPIRIVEEQTANHPAIVKVRGWSCNMPAPADPLCIQRSSKSEISVYIDKVGARDFQRLLWPSPEVTK
jgi:hypothetical protein